MTAYDEALVGIRERQSSLQTKYAKTLAEIESKQALYDKGMTALKTLGVDSVEEAEDLMGKMRSDIETELQAIQELIR